MCREHKVVQRVAEGKKKESEEKIERKKVTKKNLARSDEESMVDIIRVLRWSCTTVTAMLLVPRLRDWR